MLSRADGGIAARDAVPAAGLLGKTTQIDPRWTEMIVIFNSDVLHAEYLVRNQLPTHLDRFLSACAFNGVLVLVPETTLHEFRHDQEKRAREEQAILSAAFKRLEKWEIVFEHKSPESIISPSDLMTMIERTGVDARVLHPTLDDYRFAHLKACFHESPIPPESESDEMRDLVIWVTALRVAREHGGAVLISRDKIHTHTRGDDEADQAGLKRFKGVDDALAYLGAESPVAKPIRELLARAWSQFGQHGFPIPQMPSHMSILESRFVRGSTEVEQLMESHISIRQQPSGKVEFRVRASPSSGRKVSVEVWDIVDQAGRTVCEPFSVLIAQGPDEAEGDKVQERLAALRKVIGGDS